MKVICFDFDDVLCDGNLMLKIGSHCHDKLSEVLDVIEFMKSNKDPKKFYAAVKKIVALGKGIKFEDVESAALSLTAVQGAYETLAEIKKIGYKIVIVSSDDGDIIRKFLKKHDMMKFVDHIYASELGVKDGKLDGTISGDSIKTEKIGALKLVKKIYNVKNDDIFYIGDGLTDLAILRRVYTGILFCPNIITQTEVFTDMDLKKKIEKNELYIVETRDLREVLEYLP